MLIIDYDRLTTRRSAIMFLVAALTSYNVLFFLVLATGVYRVAHCKRHL